MKFKSARKISLEFKLLLKDIEEGKITKKEGYKRRWELINDLSRLYGNRNEYVVSLKESFHKEVMRLHELDRIKLELNKMIDNDFKIQTRYNLSI